MLNYYISRPMFLSFIEFLVFSKDLLFSVFRWDFLLLFDGNSDSSQLLAKLSGHLNDGTFQSSDGQHTGHLDADGSIKSSSNEMFVVFQSDDSEAWNGFKIQFDGGMIFKVYFIALIHISYIA